ncbi:NAD(P)-binding protein [Laetiporus sulphureus 93-53]|uniref:NAD(P)-binding protein n=1 Tax=Laetiporus sulphureus 93-53 TaxID=1314785 RepID=A0A165DXW2_9APHY|nr:NAD(P)-binding protein [Laetiporus sulphureus 93-53]KZT05845.1 NAD(P)-binding protein [Laetiporus sulphureus 93-53]
MHMKYIEQFQKGYKPPLQEQPDAPGLQKKLDPQPLNNVTADGKLYKASGKLEGKSAIITGGDSGIGLSTAILFALEGADLTLTYTSKEKDEAKVAEEEIKKETNGKRKVQMLEFDLRKEEQCILLIEKHISFHGKLDALVLNHGTQNANTYLPTLPTEQWHNTFDTNIHSFFYICKAAIPHIPPGATINFNASINMAVGHPELIDYTATKGAIIGFMRALSNQIVGEKGIRCNAVAPVLTCAYSPATMSKQSIENFGMTVPMGRAGQPVEIATAFVYLASVDSSDISGQVIHINGGVAIE